MTTNTKRSLDEITADIRTRVDIFELGKLLVEARNACAHGEWGKWLKDEFDWSQDTADNYMDAYRLADKFRTVRNLRVPLTIIYELANSYADTPADDPDLVLLPSTLEGLSSERKLSKAEADRAIGYVQLRATYGDYPAATLFALKEVDREDPWSADAIAALKQERPTEDDEAKAISARACLAYVAGLYAEHGKLPDNLPDDYMTSLRLSNVAPEHCAAVLEKLNAAESLTEDDVRMICVNAEYGEDEDEAEDDKEPAHAPVSDMPAGGTPGFFDSLVAKKKAEREDRNDVGPESKGEAQRLQVCVDELQNAKRLLEFKLEALQSEIEELKDARCEECPHCGKSLAEKQAARRNGKHEEAVA
jgi:hypothetical protein